nr:hypothetical protein [uncultured bacterium]
MTKNTKEFNIILAVDSTYMNESFWSSLTSDYVPFLAKSFEEMGTEVSKQFVCYTRQDREDGVHASPWLTAQHKELQKFADSVKGSPCDFDLPEIFRYALQEADRRPLHGLVIFAATQKQRSKGKSVESEIRPLAQRLKSLGVTVFIFDNADEYNLVSSHISSQFDKASMWANGLHVSFHSENLRTLYEYMKLIGPVVAGDLGALKKQSGDLITVHGNHLFRKCIIRLDPAGKK